MFRCFPVGSNNFLGSFQQDPFVSGGRKHRPGDNRRLKAINNGDTVDDEQLYQPITQFLEPLQNEISISLTDIRFLKKDGTKVTHIRHESVLEQLALIDKAKSFDFPEAFENKVLVLNMLNELEHYKRQLQRCK